MRLIINLLINAATAYGLTYFLNGVHFDGFSSALIFAIVLGLLNTFIKPILILFSLPLNILSLGLFSLIINALVILMASYFIESMEVYSFFDAFIFSILLSFISSMISKFIG